MTIAVARRFAVGTLLAVALVGGCGDSARNEEDGGTPLAPRAPSSSTARDEAPAPGPGLSAAPGWLREYCRSVAHRAGRDVLCPRLAPAGFAPTPNLEALPPSRSGYVIEANAETHWAFGAEVERSSVIDAYGPPARSGRPAFAGWRERGDSCHSEAASTASTSCSSGAGGASRTRSASTVETRGPADERSAPLPARWCQRAARAERRESGRFRLRSS